MFAILNIAFGALVLLGLGSDCGYMCKFQRMGKPRNSFLMSKSVEGLPTRARSTTTPASTECLPPG